MTQNEIRVQENSVLRGMVFSMFYMLNLLGWSQQLHRATVPVLQDYPFFHSEFIRNHAVQKIETQVLYKWPNQPLRNSYEIQEFEFDQRGEVMKYRSCGKNGVCTNTSYFLNKQGQLATSHYRKGTQNELHAYHYDEDGLVLKIEKNNASDASFISKEAFTYEKYSDKQYKKFYLNDEGLTYKYEVVDLDEKKRIIDSRSRFIHGVHRSSLHVVYQDDLLVEHVTNIRDVTRREEKYIMQYDEEGKLQVTELWVDAALVYRYEYLYEEGLLDAILRKNLRTQEIQITKLEYSFFHP